MSRTTLLMQTRLHMAASSAWWLATSVCVCVYSWVAWCLDCSLKLFGFAQAALAVVYYCANSFGYLHIRWIAAIFAADIGVCWAILGIWIGIGAGWLAAGVFWLLCWVSSISSNCEVVSSSAFRYVGCAMAVLFALACGTSGYMYFLYEDYRNSINASSQGNVGTADESPQL